MRQRWAGGSSGGSGVEGTGRSVEQIYCNSWEPRDKVEELGCFGGVGLL
jgi:hypothetical protein